MKKHTKFIFLALILILQNSLFSGWVLKDTPNENNLQDINISRPFNDMFYAVGNNQTIIKSTDYGITWNEVSFSGTNDFTSVFFYTQNMGLIGGDSGEFYRTINGGSTWAERNAYTEGNSINDIAVHNTSNAIVVANSGIISYSTNAGMTWQSHSSPDFDVNINSVNFIDNNTAVACGDDGLIIRSTNSGNNWSVLQTADKDYDLFGINIKDNNVWIAVSSDGRIIKTDDAGNSFTQVYYESGESINSVRYVGSNRFFAAGTNGKIYISNNSGGNWQKQFSPVTDNLNSIEYYTSNIILIAGDDGTMLYTTDAGGTGYWEMDVVNPDENSEWISGRTYNIQWDSDGIDYIDIFYSTNGGNNWQQIDNDINATTGSYSWNIPAGIESDECMVKLADSDNNNVYELSSQFKIIGNVIKITFPDSNVVYKTGEIIPITWETELDTDVNLYYSFDGSTYNSIGSMSSLDLQYDWTAPDIFSKTISLYIEDLNQPLNNFTSDELITIWNFDFTAPIEDELLITDRVYTIQWNSNITDNVELYYLSDENEQVLISTLKGNTGTYDWTPDSDLIEDGIYSLIMKHTDNDEITEVSAPFEVITKKLEIVSPEPGDIWNTFEEQMIEWNCNYNCDVKIEYSIDNKNTWTEINTVESSPASYVWDDLPDYLGEFYLKISDVDDNLIFDILPTNAYMNNRRLELLSPNGEEIMAAGQNFTLKWDGDNINKINVLFSYDNGQNYETVYTNILDTENPKIITVPHNPAEECFVKIEDSDYQLAKDINDESFSIYGIRMDSFKGGNNYLIGAEHEIDWTHLGSEFVNIYFSDDNGSSWSLIEANYPADQKPYNWIIPDNPGGLNKIKIIDTENSIFRDESETTFAIKGVKITRPEGGELWVAGSEETIEWESLTQNQFIEIQYTTDDGTNWITIDSYVDISLGAYTWSVPKNESETCRIRIANVDEPSLFDISNEFFTIDGSGIIINSPIAGDELTIGNTHTIKWGEANVNTVDIFYSTDNGNNWNYIDSDNKPNYNWTIPNTVNPSTECFIKIVDSDNGEVYDISDKFRIKSNTIAYNVPVSWNYNTGTGSNAIVILSTSVAAAMEGANFAYGDALGFFYEDDGQIKCGGYGIWENQNLSVTVWGDNPLTDEKEGFDIEEAYAVKLWDGLNGKEHNLYTTYSSNDGGRFASDRVSIISTLSAYKMLEIKLQGGVWSMISSNKLPAELNMNEVMNDVIPAFGERGFMKDEDGLVYFPFEEINTIGNWNMSNGYQIYTEEDDILTLKGIIADLYTYRKSIEANKWHIVSYLPQSAMPVETAVQSIDNYNNTTNNYTLIVKNDDGEIYYPNYAINQIGDMVPGEGYKVFSGIDETLEFPVNATSVAPKISNEEAEPVYFVKPEIKSGNNAVLIVESDDLQKGDEIGIFDENSMLIGSGVYNYTNSAITVWGDNPLSGKAKEGATYNEELEIRIYSKSEDEVYDAEISNIEDLITNKTIGNLTYFEDAVLKVNADKGITNSVGDEKKYTVTHYPNPANNFINIQSAEIIKYLTIFDINGNRLFEKEVNNDIIRINLDGYSSGIYYYELNSDNNRIINKFSIIK